MKVWSAIFNFFAVFLLFFMLISFHLVDLSMDRSFQELRLRYAVDYATEAAFLEALGGADVGLDYLDLTDVLLAPGESLRVFTTLLAKSYGLAVTDDNLTHLSNFIPVAILATNSGYYVASMQEVNRPAGTGGLHKLSWGIKRPYTVTVGNITYAVNLLNDEWISARELGGTTIELLEGRELPMGVSREIIDLNVSRSITSSVNHAISERNRLNTSLLWEYTFFMPTDITAAGIHNVDYPSLIVILQGADFAGSRRLNSVSVGGFRVERQTTVLGFTEGGIRYYCYEGQLPSHLIGSVVDFFNSVEDAARAGFSPHPIFLRVPRN